MDSILNDSKHLIRTKTSQKSFLKIFCFNNKVTMKVKDFQNSLRNKFTSPFILSNSANYNKAFKFISWPNFLEVNHILSPDIQGKNFTHWFKKCSDG